MLARWRKAGLRVRLLTELSLALAVVLVLFLLISIQTLNTSTQDALQERAVLAELIAERVDTLLGHAMLMLQSTLNSEELNLADGDVMPEKRLLQTLYDHSPLFKRIFLLDANGIVLCMAPHSDHMIGVNLAAPPYNARLAEASRPVFLQTVGFETQNPGIALMVPVQDPGGRTIGYLSGWIDLGDPRATSLLYPYAPGSGYTDLVDGQGAVLASTQPGRQAPSGAEISHFSLLVKNRQVTVGSCHSCHAEANGTRENELLAFAPLIRVPWGVALHQPEAEVFANTRALTYSLSALGLIVLVTFFVLVWMTTREFLQPLQQLTKACQQIAAGDLSTPIPAMGTSEMVVLEHSFEEMRQDLLRYRDQMQANQQDLKKRVEERTTELSQYRDHLLQTNRNLSALNAVSATLVHSLGETEALNRVLDRVLETLPAQVAGILLWDEDSEMLMPAAQRGLTQEMLSCLTRLSRTDLFPGSISPAPAEDAILRDGCRRGLTQRLEMDSVLCVPLQEKGEWLGVLFVAASGENPFRKEDEALLTSIGWQVAVGVHNARMYEALQHKERERSEMLHRIIVVQEEERKRIARELHDETSQGLASLMLGLDTLDAARQAPQMPRDLQESNKAIARQLLENVRRITTDLRPSLLDDLGLVPAVAWYGEKRLHPLGIALQLDGDGLEDSRLSPDLEIALFRIVQEAIANVIRHAHATSVVVRFERTESRVGVQISDNGQGFVPKPVPSVDLHGRGLGLRGMKERADLLGGEFHLWSAPGEGTTITVRVPLEMEQNADG